MCVTGVFDVPFDLACLRLLCCLTLYASICWALPVSLNSMVALDAHSLFVSCVCFSTQVLDTDCHICNVSISSRRQRPKRA